MNRNVELLWGIKMNKEQSKFIKEIFDLDKEINQYCDKDFIYYNRNISDEIVSKLNGVLIQYPSSYLYVDYDNKFFALWLRAHDDWILYSFGIHPHYRNKEIKNKFYKYLYNEHDYILSYLYDNNTRAINFLKSLGFKENGKIIERSDKIAIKLILDKSDNGDMI